MRVYYTLVSLLTAIAVSLSELPPSLTQHIPALSRAIAADNGEMVRAVVESLPSFHSLNSNNDGGIDGSEESSDNSREELVLLEKALEEAIKEHKLQAVSTLAAYCRRPFVLSLLFECVHSGIAFGHDEAHASNEVIEAICRGCGRAEVERVIAYAIDARASDAVLAALLSFVSEGKEQPCLLKEDRAS